MILRFDHRFAMCDYHFFSSENRTKTGAIRQSNILYCLTDYFLAVGVSVCNKFDGFCCSPTQ